MTPSPADPSTASPFVTSPDPETGIERFRLALPEHESTRGVRTGESTVADDGRYWWIYAGERTEPTTFGVVDLAEGRFRTVSAGGPAGPAPTVDTRTGVAVVADVFDVLECDPDGESRRIGRFDDFDADATGIASGVTRSVDGDRIGAIVECTDGWRVASLYRPTGELDVWHTRSARVDVALFSPTDPRLLFVARSADAAEGPRRSGAWLAREGLGARPIDDLLPDRHLSHWWDPDGDGLWCVEPGTGVGYLNLELGRYRTVWEVPARRAHATADGRLLAATVVRGEREHLVVHDPSTDDSVDVAIAPADRDGGFRPQFVAGDSHLAYTAHVEGRSAFTATPVSALRDRL